MNIDMLASSEFLQSFGSPMEKMPQQQASQIKKVSQSLGNTCNLYCDQ
jgi:hypothetical protein